MDRNLFWRIALWSVSIFGIGLTLILYFLYATNHLNMTNYVICSLQECILLNETCSQICPTHQPSCIPANFTCHFHLANYSFIYHHQTYFASQRLFVDQICPEQIDCHFSNPNSDIHFLSHDEEASFAVGILIICAMIIFCSCCILIPFEYYWRTRLHPDSEVAVNNDEMATSLLIKEEYQSV